jgi:DNA-binding NarL/FixJ family response regulator
MQSQVIICDQQTVYALGSASLVKKHPLYKQAKIIDDLSELYNNNYTGAESVLVVDSSMFDFSQQHFKESIVNLKQRIPIMVVLNTTDDKILYQLIDNGISVIVSRDVTREEWLKGLEMAKQDKVYFSTHVADKVFALVNNMDDIQLDDKLNELSLFDKYILIRICEEAPSKLIASELSCSKRTIEGHRTKMMQLFEVKNVAGLVKIACLSKLYENYLSNPGLYEVALCAKTSSL